MYVGMAGGLLAHAIWRGNLGAAVPFAGFVALMDRSQIPAEERAMRVRFGDEFERYAARVPRWLGRVDQSV